MAKSQLTSDLTIGTEEIVWNSFSVHSHRRKTVLLQGWRNFSPYNIVELKNNDIYGQ